MAQKWLDILRRVYPSAFLGEAPAELPDPPQPAPSYSSSEKREVKGGVTTRTRERQVSSALRESLEALGASELDMYDDELNRAGVGHLCVELREDRPETRSTKGAASRRRVLDRCLPIRSRRGA